MTSNPLVASRTAARVDPWAGVWIAEDILATMRAAQAELTEHVRQATAETVGADSETGRAVLASFANRFPAPAEATEGDGDADR